MVPTAEAIVNLYSLRENTHQTLPQVVKNRLIVHELGIKVVPTVIIFPEAFQQFCQESNLHHQLSHHLSLCDPLNPASFNTTAKNIRKVILNATLPRYLFREIITQLNKDIKDQWVTLESDPIQKPLTNQMIAFIGESVIAKKIIEFWSKWFTPQRVSLYTNSSLLQVPPLVLSALPLASMVGTISTSSPFLEHKHFMRVNLVMGQSFGPADSPLLPSNIILDRISGQVVSIQPLAQSLRYQLTRDGELVKIPQKPEALPVNQINIPQIIKISRQLHNHFLTPQKITMILTKKDIFIWNIEPLDIFPATPVATTTHLTSTLHPLGKGVPLSPGIVTGTLLQLKPKPLPQPVSADKIVYLEQCHETMLPCLRRVKGVIIGSGSPYADWAIRLREMGIPSIILDSTKFPKKTSGQTITLDGNQGVVYAGCLRLPSPASNSSPKIFQHPPSTKTATKIIVTASQTPINSDLNADGLFINPAASNGSYQGNIKNLEAIISQAIPLSGERLILYKPLIDSKYSSTENILAYQIKTIMSIQDRIGVTHVGLVFPSIKLASQWSVIKKTIAAMGYIRSQRRQLLVNIETPHLLMEIDALAKIGIDGIVIDLDHLIPRMLGVKADTVIDTDVLKGEHDSIKTMLEFGLSLAEEQNIASYVTGVVVSQQFHYLSDLVKLGVDGLITQTSLIPPLRHRIAFLERRLIQKKALPYASH